MRLDARPLVARGARPKHTSDDPPFCTGVPGSHRAPMRDHPWDQDIARVLQRAVRFHTDGERERTEDLYQHILQRSPDHFDALHLLGVLRHQQNRSVEALDLIEAALRRIPGSADALASCDAALLIKPDHIDALSNRAQVLLRLQRFADALASADAALALEPDHIPALNNRG